jgi:hypothetical protein
MLQGGWSGRIRGLVTFRCRMACKRCLGMRCLRIWLCRFYSLGAGGGDGREFDRFSR